ncbi:MAG: Fur family transcriptional regulator [Rikenellaceae bacterium]
MKQAAYDRLNECGIRASVQRVEIMNYMLDNLTHPDSDKIYSALSKTMPTLSKTTVYNTLKLFAQKGAVTMLDIDSTMLHFDADTTPHAHFFCKECNKIYDLPLTVDLTSSCSEHQIDEALLYYKGICKECK